MDLQCFILEFERELPCLFSFHTPLLRAEVTRFVYQNNAQIQKDSNLDRWANVFIERHIQGWRKRVELLSIWNEPLIAGSNTPMLVCRPKQEDTLRFRRSFSDAWLELVIADGRDTILAYWQVGTLP